jgi:L-malate glycosyltransferase
MARRITTLFPICENVHLTKDLGQIPYYMHKQYGYDGRVASYRNSESYNNLEGEVKGLRLDFFENKGRFSFVEKGALRYIRANARKTDVLTLYIFSKHSFVYGIYYKLLNPKGFLFLKLDGYNETFSNKNKIVHSTKKLKNWFLGRLEKKFLKVVDLITIENQEGEKLVKAMFPSCAHKVMYLPVGVNDIFLLATFGDKLRTFSEKENIILTTGRIGEEIKNNEMMLRALAGLKMQDWKMVFVGPVNPAFSDFFEKMCQEFPALRSRVVFTGAIHDRVELYRWYDRAKIFCMTSRVESFCHSIAEALYFGNYIIGTEGIMSMKDITDSGRYGQTLRHNDHEALARALRQLINDQAFLEKLYPQIIAYSRQNFVWSRIIEKLNQKLEK